MRNIKRGTGFLLLVLLILAWQAARAVQTGDSASVNIKMTVVYQSVCKVSDGQWMDVAFGDVSINKVASGELIRPLVYTVDCGQTTDTISMAFKAFATSPAGFDTATIATSVPGLGARLLKDGKPQPIMQWFKITDQQHPPKLEFQLVKAPGVNLQPGPFSAIGVLLVEYI